MLPCKLIFPYPVGLEGLDGKALIQQSGLGRHDDDKPPIRQLTQPCCGNARHRELARSVGWVRLTLSPGRITMLVIDGLVHGMAWAGICRQLSHHLGHIPRVFMG